MTINPSSSSAPVMRELQAISGRDAAKTQEIEKQATSDRAINSTKTGPAANAAITDTTGTQLNVTA